MDPAYAPAWQELGLRSYYDATYADGGEKMLQQSNDAYARALHLDPNLTVALGQQITNAVERGELGKAYDAALWALVKKSSAKRAGPLCFELCLPLRRNAGTIGDRVQHGAIAGSRQLLFRSCAWTFMELGETERAADFLRLDAGSEWAAYVTPSLLVREGKIAEAKEAAVKHMPTAPRYHRDLLETCLGSRPASQQDRIAHDLESTEVNELDPELLYYQGAWLGYCGKNQAALQLLQAAVERSLRLFQHAERSYAGQAAGRPGV